MVFFLIDNEKMNRWTYELMLIHLCAALTPNDPPPSPPPPPPQTPLPAAAGQAGIGVYPDLSVSPALTQVKF